jgi:glucose/arabinose dehydrogenase
MASLEMTFYPSAGEFPKQYDGDAFAAEHGSWNRLNRAGYEVIRIPMHKAMPTEATKTSSPASSRKMARSGAAL